MASDVPLTNDMLKQIKEAFAQRPGGDLRREDFTPERIEVYRALVAAHGGGETFLSQEEREANRAAFLAQHPPHADLWVFGYGSLMWNPAIETAEAATARICGFHRSFSLTLQFGRATPDRPGLMLVLRDGGNCEGVAHRIAADKVDSETRVLWMREMLSGAYLPQWLELDFGSRPTAKGFTFVANATHPRVEPQLSLEATAARIAVAEGDRGTNRDYLFNCAAALAARGLNDPYISALDARVRSFLSESQAEVTATANQENEI